MSSTDEQTDLDDLDFTPDVVDESEGEIAVGRIFQITTYGADYTVDVLVSRLKSGSFITPSFQRSYVWTLRQASRFIESILLGLPIPSVFLFKRRDGKHLIVDGQQRLKTLLFFFDEIFAEGARKDKAFRLTEVQGSWDGKKFPELSESDQLRLRDTVIHTIVFQQEKPENNDDSVYEVFERLNTGGLKLSAQEIRVCVNYGKFADMLKSLNEDDNWRQIYGEKSMRLKDQELILRFLALSYNFGEYKRPMKTFLNNFMETHEKADASWLDAANAHFRGAIAEAFRLLGKKAFRPEKQLNAAVYDSVTFAIAQNLAKGIVREPEEFSLAYEALLQDAEYKDAYLKSTADEERVAQRIKKAIQYLCT